MGRAFVKLYMLNSVQHFGKRISGVKTQSSRPFSDTVNYSALGKFVYMLLNFTEFQKKESSRKASASALLTKPKPLTVWITINCRKFLKRWGHQTKYLTCFLRNLYASQEATGRTGHGTMGWFQIGKGVC